VWRGRTRCALGRASTRSSIEGLARPVRTVAKLRFVLSMLFSMRDIWRAHARVPGKSSCLVRARAWTADGRLAGCMFAGAHSVLLYVNVHVLCRCLQTQAARPAAGPAETSAALLSAVCKMRSTPPVTTCLKGTQHSCIPGCSLPSIVSRSRWPAAVPRRGPRRQCPDMPAWRADGQRITACEQHWSRHWRCCG